MRVSFLASLLRSHTCMLDNMSVRHRRFFFSCKSLQESAVKCLQALTLKQDSGVAGLGLLPF